MQLRRLVHCWEPGSPPGPSTSPESNTWSAPLFACHQNRPAVGSAVIPSHSDLTYTVSLFNADSAGNPLEHFSAEEAGLQTFYFLLLLAYFIACCIYVQPLYQALRKGGPMHTVLKVLTMALALQGCSALCNYIHLASLGYGIPGVHAVYDTEPVHGLDSEPQQEVPEQTSAVGADPGLHRSRCQRSRHSGCDHRCDPLPINLHGDPLPALPLSFSLLGGLRALLRFFATHHVQKQPEGALLRPARFTSSPLGGHVGGGETSKAGRSAETQHVLFPGRKRRARIESIMHDRR
ncbi:unnamed protein product [Tetraodon nigroviridis]|uniref:(spotted green pufferfish) hypothetical protein n=1 Tax=Tetraodon nigroviridis TaxID=99883 RepID=Q4RY78_TETNG|nr:unnamed protein product [Tetraodon nigroviridis]